ncbi:hypothetical protein KUTeg_011160 [Tegillarca granosa]|uniref:Fibrinogen C-terminal domain-containing protein n=1 Tax=Tegillarca granosa TaxID=220873 RepID=A0ABQ9F1L2_TEGGR|nr:hypothetical protein KUTeg_011160 [Tegillarca granosa]
MILKYVSFIRYSFQIPTQEYQGQDGNITLLIKPVSFYEELLEKQERYSDKKGLININKIKPRDCEDLYKMGNTIDGVYSIYRKGSQYDVYCDMNRHGWTVFQRRLDGSTDFYRDWNSYVTGFGNMSCEFWLGLEKIYELTSSATYSLRFDMEDFNGVRKFALYDNFKLDDASKNYKLNFDNYIGNAGDSFSYHKGNRFATFDNDHYGCSVGYSGAWWYNLCLYSNLNGLYNSTEFGKGINWKNWHGLYYSLKTTEIKIRRM